MWQVNDSGVNANKAPIPLSLSVPAGYSDTIADGPLLLDPSRVRFQISPPIIVPENCNCSLALASFCFSQPNVAGVNDGIENIKDGNNRITIKFGLGFAQDYTIPLGLYSTTDLQYALNQIARTQGWIIGATELFILTGISATQKIVFTLNPAAFPSLTFPSGGITISFTNSGVDGYDNSMGKLIGFPTNPSDPNFTNIVAVGGGATLVSVPAPNVASFSDTSSYNLYMSILKDSYLNGVKGQLLYSFPIGPYQPNAIVREQPTLRFPVQCQSDSIGSIDVWTTDQAGKKLPWKYYQSPFSFSFLISKNKADGSL